MHMHMNKYIRYVLKLKKTLLSLLTALFIIASSGCVYRVDIQRLAIITVMGIDINEEGRYRASFQILQASYGGRDGGGRMSRGGGEGPGVIYFEGTGETIYEAATGISDRASRKPHYGHMKAVVIGKAAAEQGIAPVIDFLGRFNEIRSNILILTTKGEAAAIVGTTSQEHGISADTIDELATRHIESGIAPVSYLAHTIDTLAAENKHPVITVLNLPRKSQEPGDASFKIEGIAAFKGDKLLGYLSPDETKGLQYIQGKLEVGTSVLKVPDGPKISIEVLSTSSKIRTEVANGKPSVCIDIKQYASVREMPGNLDPGENPEILDEIGAFEAEAIKKQVEATLRAVQRDLELDIIDIGGEIYRQHPKEWKKIEDSWEEMFPQLGIKVNVECTIRATGLMSKPAH
jgi:spore germination protein KC